MEKLWREINYWEVNKINYKDCRAAADCLRTLGFEQDKNQTRTSEGRVRLLRKKEILISKMKSITSPLNIRCDFLS